MKVTRLTPGQTATVLQLPAATHHSQHVEIGRRARSSDWRIVLNRAELGLGMASILVPNQGAVMLWQTFRNAAIELSIAFLQSFRRLKAHAPVVRTASPAERIEESLETDVLTVTLPKAASPKPKKKIKVKAVA